MKYWREDLKDFDDTEVDYNTAVESAMLESYGIEEDAVAAPSLVESSSGEKDDEKRFGVDRFGVYGEDDMDDLVDRIVSNEAFHSYCDELYNSLDADRDILVYEQWSDSMIRDELERFLDGLYKGQYLRYADFFEGILSKSDVEETKRLLDKADRRFDEMVHVVRLPDKVNYR